MGEYLALPEKLSHPAQPLGEAPVAKISVSEKLLEAGRFLRRDYCQQLRLQVLLWCSA